MPDLKLKGPLNTTPSLEAVEGYRYALILNIIFGGMINVFSNKSITTSGFTYFMVSISNDSSVNDYRKPLYIVWKAYSISLKVYHMHN